MAARIKKELVVENNILGEFIGQAEKTLTLIAANTKAAEALHTETVKLSKAFDGSVKSQRELIALDIKSEQLVREKIKKR